jgi:hypothetical protein
MRGILTECSLAEAKLHLLPKALSHCERESLILSEDLTCRLSSASGASRIDTRQDSPNTGGIKLAPIFGAFICKTVLPRLRKDRGEVV